jgi:DNA-binding response OmpR family regulator
MTTQAANGASSNDFSVLMVEDSPPQALKMKMALENNGCHVYWSETGLGGLGMAQQRRFDLILLDVELPDINGFEICRKLKADEELKHIPVVMLTTLDGANDVMSGLDAGAVDYIPKDAFAELVLLETIKQMNEMKN